MAYTYFNGQLIEESKASISIHNLGLQRGFGIFDLFRGRNGRPVFLEDHLERFDRSQAFLGLERSIAKDEIRQAVADLQRLNGFNESTFRLMLLGDGKESDPVLKSLFYVTNSDISSLRNPETASVILHEYVREYPEIKSINYLTSNRLHRKKMAAGAIDVIYHSNGLVSEASRSNVFIVRDGHLSTPQSSILHGITRKQLLAFAEEIAPTKVEDFSVEDLLSADEVFICSTLKEVLSITTVDGQKIGDGRTGSFTRKIQKRFLELVA